jgi:hypothetical protein
MVVSLKTSFILPPVMVVDEGAEALLTVILKADPVDMPPIDPEAEE